MILAATIATTSCTISLSPYLPVGGHMIEITIEMQSQRVIDSVLSSHVSAPSLATRTAAHLEGLCCPRQGVLAHAYGVRQEGLLPHTAGHLHVCGLIQELVQATKFD